MFQKLLDPFKSKGPKVSGDLHVSVQQNPVFSPNSHMNMMTIGVKQGQPFFKWSRSRGNQEALIQNSGPSYIFSLSDIGYSIKVLVTLGNQKATITIGPIVIDKGTQMSLGNILQNNGFKFPITIQGLIVTNGDRIVGKLREANVITTLAIGQEEFKLLVESKNLMITIKHTLQQPLVKVDEQIHFLFQELDFQNFEQMKLLVKSILGYSLNKDDQVDIQIQASSQKHSDLIVLSLKLFGAKNIIVNQKSLTLLDRICVGVFDEVSFDGNGDLMLTISNLQEQINEQYQQIQAINREKFSLVNKLNTMEQEIEQTIATYQQILQENNISSFSLSITSSSIGKSLGKSGIWQKQIDQKQNEVNELRSQIEKLRVIKEVKIETNYNLMTREAMIKQMKELESSWQNAKRLNELLNRELKKQNSSHDQEQIEELQQKIIQLEFQNQLVEDYHNQILSQQKQIDALNHQILQYKQGQSNNNELIEYVRQLEEEINYLRNMSETRTDTMSNSQVTQIQANYQLDMEGLQEQNQKLREQIDAMKRKHNSLIKEMESFQRNPNKVTEFQFQAQLQKQEKEIAQKNQKINILLQQNEQLRIELKKSQQNISFLQDMQECSQADNESRYSKKTVTECSKMSVSPSLNRGVSRSEHHGIFDELPPQPKIGMKKLQLVPQPHHNQKAFSMISFE